MNGPTVTQHFSFYTSTPEALTGLSSYTDSFVSAYAKRFAEHQVVLHTNANSNFLPACVSCKNIEIRTLSAYAGLPYKLRALWAQTKLAYQLRRNGRALVSTTPFASLLPFCKLIATMHDLYDVDFKYRKWYNVVFFRLLYLWYRFVLHRLIAVSNTTAKLSLPYFGPSERKILVALEASKFNVSNDDDILEHRPRGEFLYVANIANTKNFECLIQTLKLAEQEDLPISVKWVGQDPRGIAKGVLDENGGSDLLKPLGGVSDDELVKLYEASDALIVTSWTEGFCLPVLEAQAFGCTTIVSDIPIMREVAGECSLFFSPSKPEEALSRIKSYLAPDYDEANARKQALENARKFSWDRSAGLLEEILVDHAANT